MDAAGERISRRAFLRTATTLTGGALGVLALGRPALAAPLGRARPAPGGLIVAPALRAAGTTLNVAAQGDIDTGDPHVSPLLLFNNMVRLTCFSSLVRYTPDMQYTGDLAESWSNPDETTYVFTLRKGVKYHNGEEVEASHVTWSFKRIGEKKGIFASRVANIASYTELDKYTLQIKLNKPQADFVDGLILLSVAPPSAEASLAKLPVGSGPFKFVEWVPNDHITLAKHADYYDPSVAKVDTITFHIIPDPSVAITNLQAGSVDGILELPISQAAFYKDSADPKALIVPTSSIQIYEMLGKNNQAVRTNASVRQALAMCLDKEAVKSTVFAGAGNPKWTWVPTSNWAFKDEAGYSYDPDKAKQMLEAAGAGGLSLTITIPSGYPDGEKTTTIWQSGLEKAGVTVKAEVQELSVWLNNYINHTYDVTWNVWPGFNDPNYVVAFGLSTQVADGWTNPKAKELVDSTNATLDQAKRKELYGEFQDIFVQDLPYLVVQEVPQASLVKPNVSGWEINPLGFVLVRGVALG